MAICEAPRCTIRSLMSAVSPGRVFCVGLCFAWLLVGCAATVQTSSGNVPKICGDELRSYAFNLHQEVSVRPQNRDAWILLGTIYLSLGDLSSARETAGRMKQLFPQDTVMLSRTLDSIEEFEKGNYRWESCVDRDLLLEQYANALAFQSRGSQNTNTDATLEITTVPLGAHIVANDRYLGNSPIRTTVPADRSVTIQALMQGYQDAVKVVDGVDLKPGSTHNIVLRLEKIQ